MSHPLGVRELKLNNMINAENVEKVAPFRGAWIETDIDQMAPSTNSVSHPLGVRELKPKDPQSTPPGDPVAPFRGAWIETKKSV